jgi:hypothetical protein
VATWRTNSDRPAKVVAFTLPVETMTQLREIALDGKSNGNLSATVRALIQKEYGRLKDRRRSDPQNSKI